MSNAPAPEVPGTESQVQEERFLGGAVRRIHRFMIAIALVAAVIIWLRYGTAVGIGFVVGCGVASLNLYWLERAVNAFAERAVSSEQKGGSGAVTVRFLVRYALMVLAACAILTVSLRSLYGFLAGLFLPVPAILAEAFYETYRALRRGL